MKRLFLFSIIFIFCFSVSIFANTDEMQPAIRNTVNGYCYTNFETASIAATSGTIFELGLYSDTEGWEINQQYFYNFIVIDSAKKGIIPEKYYIEIDNKILVGGQKFKNYNLIFGYKIIYPAAENIEYFCYKE